MCLRPECRVLKATDRFKQAIRLVTNSGMSLLPAGMRTGTGLLLTTRAGAPAEGAESSLPVLSPGPSILLSRS